MDDYRRCLFWSLWSTRLPYEWLICKFRMSFWCSRTHTHLALTSSDMFFFTCIWTSRSLANQSLPTHSYLCHPPIPPVNRMSSCNIGTQGAMLFEFSYSVVQVSNGQRRSRWSCRVSADIPTQKALDHRRRAGTQFPSGSIWQFSAWSSRGA